MKKPFSNNRKPRFGASKPRFTSSKPRFGDAKTPFKDSRPGNKPAFKIAPSTGSKPSYTSRTPFKGSVAAPKNPIVAPKRGPSPIPQKAPGEFPMRINKYLSWKGYSTRRAADDLIAKKKVTINGQFARLGDQVKETDAVEVRGHKQAEDYVYYAYNKPAGVAIEPTRKGNPDISQIIPLKGIFPVGGLDMHSAGLLILTNDRRIIDRLLNPAHPHDKEFLIRTINPVKPNFKEKMEAGVIIRGGAPIYCKVEMIRDTLFTVRMTDSSHLREMCAMFFAEVQTLTRTQVLNIRLDRLATNSYRKIEDAELEVFLKSLGL